MVRLTFLPLRNARCRSLCLRDSWPGRPSATLVLVYGDSGQIGLFRETCAVARCSPPSGTFCSRCQLRPGTLRARVLFRSSRMVRLCARSSSHGLGPRAPGQGPCLAHLSSAGPAARRFTEVCWTCGRSREVTIVHRSMFTWRFTQGIKAEAPVHRPVAARRTKGQYMP